MCFLTLELLSPRLIQLPVGEADAPDVYASFIEEVLRYMFPAQPKDVADSLQFIRKEKTRR